MCYKISICFPDKEEIKVQTNKFNKRECLNFFENYPWVEQLKLLKQIPEVEVHYNPSIRFTNVAKKRSLELTAFYQDSQIMFSFWFERPVKKKTVFGLFWEKDIMKVIDKSAFDKETSLKYLDIFLEEKYDKLEVVMNR